MTAKNRIVIVGVGALGSHVALLLRNAPATLVVVDFDRSEPKNVASQLHIKTYLGRNKAEGLKQAMLGMFGLTMEASPYKVSPDNISAILGRTDLVVDCVDNGDTRRLIQGFCRERGIPCIHGALAAGGALGRAVWSPVFVPDDVPPGAATCDNGDHLPHIVLTAGALAQSIQTWLATGIGASVQVQGLTMNVVDERPITKVTRA